MAELGVPLVQLRPRAGHGNAAAFRRMGHGGQRFLPHAAPGADRGVVGAQRSQPLRAGDRRGAGALRDHGGGALRRSRAQILPPRPDLFARLRRVLSLVRTVLHLRIQRLAGGGLAESDIARVPRRRIRPEPPGLRLGGDHARDVRRRTPDGAVLSAACARLHGVPRACGAPPPVERRGEKTAPGGGGGGRGAVPRLGGEQDLRRQLELFLQRGALLARIQRGSGRERPRFGRSVSADAVQRRAPRAADVHADRSAGKFELLLPLPQDAVPERPVRGCCCRSRWRGCCC